MEEKSQSTAEDQHDRIRLGMSSFGPEEREQFGQKVRLAIACIEGSAKPVTYPIPIPRAGFSRT